MTQDHGKDAAGIHRESASKKIYVIRLYLRLRIQLFAHNLCKLFLPSIAALATCAFAPPK